MEQIEEITNATSLPHALYKAKSNGYSFITKIDSGDSHNVDKIKTSNKLAKLQITLTGARGSKLAFLGFADITCSLRKFTFTEEFAVIKGMVSDMLLGIRWEHKFSIHTGWTGRGNHYISTGKNNFVAESTNKLNVHPIIKTKGKVTLKLESISFIEVQASRDISGNKKYQLNPNAYLPNGIIPLDPIHSFKKTPRTLQLPFLNVSTNCKPIPRGSLLGTFEPVDEEINVVHTTSWEKLDKQVQQAHAQLQKKRSYRNAREKVQAMERESYEKLPRYPPSSSMEMETLMKRPEVALEDMKNADKSKTKVINMLEAKFASIISKSSADVGHTNLHTVDLQVSDGSPMFVKQYTIPLKYPSFIDKETKWLEEAGLISRSLSNWSAPCMVMPKSRTWINLMRYNSEWS